MLPLSALQRRTARSITVWRTASRSNFVRAIVWITSCTAAARSSASSCSRRSSAVSSSSALTSLTVAIFAHGNGVRQPRPRDNSGTIFSPSDLNDFLECEHLTALELVLARGTLVRPERDDPQGDLIRRKGEEH